MKFKALSGSKKVKRRVAQLIPEIQPLFGAH